MYDDQHIQKCDACCTHSDGWEKLENHYGGNNGKYSCRNGCGTIVDEPSIGDEEGLMEQIKEALADVLGRNPTHQEILRAHAGFKRMAFIMYEHVRKQQKGPGDKPVS